ncbi:MAG: lipocalin-like domain-containing protein [Acidobacteriota bacterium]
MRIDPPQGRRIRTWAALLALPLLPTATSCRLGDQETATLRSTLTMQETLASTNEGGYERAVSPRKFSFPADHGPHPEYRSEWWYFTGNLQTDLGRNFGFQLVFFRTAMAPSLEKRASAWATRQVYMAHFAVTDVGNRRFYAFERFERGALGLAGARAAPFNVWLDGWSAQADPGSVFPWRLRASAEATAIALTIEPLKPVVLRGDEGLSRKGENPGNASYYYSLTRLRTTGTIRIGDQRFPVEGLSWFDREWSSSALEDGQVGWDWFALQLSDGSELSFYQLRRRDGTTDPHSSGTLVTADGAAIPLTHDQVLVDVTGSWRSPRDGRSYPHGWRLRIPSAGLDLMVSPYLDDQELAHAFRYWEGAVKVTGMRGPLDGTPISGDGYVELTGYADSPRQLLSLR